MGESRTGKAPADAVSRSACALHGNLPPDARFDLILVDEQPAGRVYVDTGLSEIRLIDITLLPKYRGRGIAERTLCDLLQEAERLRLPVRLHVAHSAPARRLYDRLGFRQVDDTGVHILMEWTPAATGGREETA